MLYPQRHVCLVSREVERVKRTYEALHKAEPYHDGTETHWAAEWSEDTPYHYDDGVTLWVSPVDVNPDDQFLRAVNHGDSPRESDSRP